jgi:hypothetical protein
MKYAFILFSLFAAGVGHSSFAGCGGDFLTVTDKTKGWIDQTLQNSGIQFAKSPLAVEYLPSRYAIDYLPKSDIADLILATYYLRATETTQTNARDQEKEFYDTRLARDRREVDETQRLLNVRLEASPNREAIRTLVESLKIDQKTLKELRSMLYIRHSNGANGC